jgi:hypothetical protein
MDQTAEYERASILKQKFAQARLEAAAAQATQTQTPALEARVPVSETKKQEPNPNVPVQDQKPTPTEPSPAPTGPVPVVDSGIKLWTMADRAPLDPACFLPAADCVVTRQVQKPVNKKAKTADKKPKPGDGCQEAEAGIDAPSASGAVGQKEPKPKADKTLTGRGLLSSVFWSLNAEILKDDKNQKMANMSSGTSCLEEADNTWKEFLDHVAQKFTLDNPKINNDRIWTATKLPLIKAIAELPEMVALNKSVIITEKKQFVTVGEGMKEVVSVTVQKNPSPAAPNSSAPPDAEVWYVKYKEAQQSKKPD